MLLKRYPDLIKSLDDKEDWLFMAVDCLLSFMV